MTEPLLEILSPDWAWPNFRRDVFQLVAWGYQIMEKEIRQCQLEEDITGLIRKGSREKLDIMEEAQWLHFRKYSLHNEDPIDDSGSLGKKRPRIDILIELTGSRPVPRYCLEAKRCARKKYNSKYTIDWYAEGILSFVARRYSKDSPEAGLLGLLQSDTTTYWKTELSARLDADQSLSCQAQLAEVDFVPELPDMSVSQHQRNDGSTISLYHAFLDCNP